MPYFAFKATKSTYGGLHGVFNIGLVECETPDEADYHRHIAGLELFDEYDIIDDDDLIEPETDGEVYQLTLPNETDLTQIEQELNDDFEETVRLYHGILVN